MKKQYNILILVGLIAIFMVGCTKDFEEINTNPNRPAKVPTVNLILSAEKGLMDDIMDEWFSGRQGLLWTQYWSQRNYTSEDRFGIRENVNSQYFQFIYTDITDLIEIIKMNEDPAEMKLQAKYGANVNQIAVCKILKAWAFQILTDTYGDIPYSGAFGGAENPAPKYTPQKDIYIDLLTDLKKTSESIDVSQPAFTSGDIIYGGDALLWKKFANSLRLRVANRLSKVTDADAVALRNSTIKEILDSVAVNPDYVFSSNADNARFQYISDGTGNAPMYDAFFTSARNDMTVSAQFVDLLKGINDTLNNKVNPFVGNEDPRIAVWVPKVSGKYRGMPYGIPDKDASALRTSVANIRGANNIVLHQDFATVYMDYAEVCFLLCELNSFDPAWYQKGIEASLDYWGASDAAYVTAITALPVTAENVFTQKYIALYMNGYEAWAEYRRTGYPKTLVHPGEFTGPNKAGDIVTFTVIPQGVTDIPRRLTYPKQEYEINGVNVKAAASAIGGDDFGTKLWWDK